MKVMFLCVGTAVAFHFQAGYSGVTFWAQKHTRNIQADCVLYRARIIVRLLQVLDTCIAQVF
jgi:hypothetical protein